MTNILRVVVIGGGAAGFFGAITSANTHPQARVTILEAGSKPLTKVRISGGGRCNVTHHCFEPAELVKNYPRGGKALQGAFSRFQPQDTVVWFAEQGVRLKTEADGRMFPVTDNSETIVNCLLKAAKTAGVKLRLGCSVKSVSRLEKGFEIRLKTGEILQCDRLLIATGGNPLGHRFAKDLGHTIESPVPSLFTFNVRDPRLQDLAGVSAENVSLKLIRSCEVRPPRKEAASWAHPAAMGLTRCCPSLTTSSSGVNSGTPCRTSLSVAQNLHLSKKISSGGKKRGNKTAAVDRLQQTGPLLITHWGLSGPAVLKLSAWGARILYENNYHMQLIINWVPQYNPETLRQYLLEIKSQIPRKKISSYAPVSLPRRFWQRLVNFVGINDEKPWAELSKKNLNKLVQEMTQGRYQIEGKGVFKEEFVTCGGVNLKEVNFKTMESKICPGLYFAGEILDIDGVTGGFNFQSAWTTSWIAGKAIGN